MFSPGQGENGRRCGAHLPGSGENQDSVAGFVLRISAKSDQAYACGGDPRCDPKPEERNERTT
jgi:hypothetical protein